MNFICLKGPVKLLQHITAAHINAAYHKDIEGKVIEKKKGIVSLISDLRQID